MGSALGSASSSTSRWRLHAVSEDSERIFPLQEPHSVSIGRDPDRDISLPQQKVSRLHAQVHWAAAKGRERGHWRLRDCGSTWGTLLNGVRLAAQQEVKLAHGDVIEIKPWTLTVAAPSVLKQADLGQTLMAGDDSDDFVPLGDVQGPSEFAQAMLVRLLAASEAMAIASDEQATAAAAVEALAAATGFANVALLKAGTEPSAVEVLAQTGAISGSRGEVQISRSLLRRARHGVYVHRAAGGVASMAASIESLSIQDAICVPVEAGSVFFGWIYLDHRLGAARTRPAPEAEAAGFAAAIARLAGLSLSNIARARMQQRFDLEQQQMFGGTMRALISAIDAKDPYTRGHSDRVSAFGVLLAKALKLDAGTTEQIRLCGLVHDIGKIGIPEEILRKPSKLDDTEFARIQRHPEIGASILQDIPQMRELICGVIEHHERWDGRGYPNKLAGEGISRLGRILCIADCFDAMTSARFYRPAREVQEVLSEIERCLGTHFDPNFGKAFLSIPVSELAPLISTAAPPPS